MKRLLVFLIAAFVWSAVCRTEAASPADGPYYGVCSHLHGDSLAEKKLPLMHAAGIRCARADFRWGSIEPKPGQWDFSQSDRLVELAEKNSVTLLPVLSQNDDYLPTVEHLGEWTEYIRRTVTRYQDKIRCWEIVNETNLAMLHDGDLPPEEYAVMIRAAYETIKAIDPDLVVVHGGLAGAPAGYIERELKAGAAGFFDVMNIHTYRGGMKFGKSVEWFTGDIIRIFDLMKRYGLDDVPIWITEMGFSSLPSFGEMYNGVLAVAVKLMIPDPQGKRFAFLYDERYIPGTFYYADSLRRMFPRAVGRDQIDQIRLDDLEGISPDDYAALLLPPCEAFPSPWFDDLCRYVRDGGNLFLLGGIPFRYEVEEYDGRYAAKNEEAPNDYRAKFGLDYVASWKDPAVPAISRCQVVDWRYFDFHSQLLAMIDGFGDTYQCTRFLSNAPAKANDKISVIYQAVEGDFRAPVIEYIRPAWAKGAVLVSTLNELETTNLSTLEDQAVYLPQLMLTAFSSGVSSCFWYEFQNPQVGVLNKEHNFGLVHKNLTPKPVYQAYKTLIEARPADSRSTFFDIDGDLIRAGWECPDGTNAVAVWRAGDAQDVELKFTGQVTKAFDYLGNEISVPEGKISLSPKALYFIGPESVEFVK